VNSSRRSCKWAAHIGVKNSTMFSLFVSTFAYAPVPTRRFPRTLIAELSDHICYDNEAYMNTGIQKSSFTPFGARNNYNPGREENQRFADPHEEHV